MRKLFLSLAIFATALVGAQQAEAGLGIIPSMTTYSSQVKDAPAVVKARISEVVVTQVEGVAGDALMYRQNAADLWHKNAQGEDYCNSRRDLKLEITEVFRTADGVEMETGEFMVISPEQRQLSQLPASLQNGEEAIFFLTPRVNSENWEIRGNMRGLISKEDAGTLAGAETLIEDLVGYRADAVSNGELSSSNYAARAQDRMLNEIAKIDSRLAVDALIDFGWNYETYGAHFTSEESAILLSYLEDTTSGSTMRNELITAIGRTTPEGGQAALVTLVATDSHASTTALGAWALEQYGRGTSSDMLLDAYAETTDNANRAALIRAVGLIRPKSYRTSEAGSRARFVEVLRSTTKKTEDAAVLKESLIAARDMRFVEDELYLNLVQITQEFKAGLIEDERVYKRAIVALASTRTEKSREFLLGLKGEFAVFDVRGVATGKYDKHIDLAMQMPFHTLVDNR